MMKGKVKNWQVEIREINLEEGRGFKCEIINEV